MTQALIGLSGLGGVGCVILGIMLALARSDARNLRLIAQGRAIEIDEAKKDLALEKRISATTRERLEAVILAKELALKDALKDLDQCTTPSAIRARLNRLTGG